MDISKIRSFLSLSSDEELVDAFKPVRYGDITGILILSNKRVIVAEERGFISKSYKPISSVELTTLTDMRVLSQAEAKSIRLGEYVVASQDAEGLVKFYNQRIFAQVQILKGLVKYKGQWMKPEEKFEQEMLDKGLVQYKGKWMTSEEKFEQEQKDKGLLKFMGRWGTPEQVDKWKKLYAGLTSDFMDRSPHEFEDFIAELFTRMGYSAERTPLTSDYGADVIAKKGNEVIAVQVKRNKPGNDVGVKDVNQVLGSMYRYNANKAVVITTSDFTFAARKLATSAPVDLWNRTKLYEMIERYFFGESEGKSITEEISSKKRELVKWFRKALALTDLQKYQEAIEAYEWVLELTKDLEGLEKVAAEAWNNKGLCMHRLGKLEEAINCFDKALEINPALQVADDNKVIVQKELEKTHVRPQQEKTKPVVTEERKQVYLPLTEDSTGKEAIFETRWYKEGLSFKIRFLGFNPVGKTLSGDRGRAAYEANGEIFELSMQLTNLLKKEIDGWKIAKTLVLEDQEGYQFIAQTDLQEKTERSYRFSGWSGAKAFLPKIPVGCSIFFELPHAKGNYKLTVREYQL